MAQYWKTGAKLPRRHQISWPAPAQLLRQLGLVVAIVALWGALLFGYLRLAGGAQTEIAAAEPETAPVEVIPTETPTLVPSATASPTQTAAPVLEPTETKALSKGDNALLAEPAPAATETPTPEPTATETPAPPTDTPEPQSDSAEVSFSEDVFPIIERRCVKCHGGVNDDGEQRIEEGLKLLSYDDILAGSWNGPVIEPGNVEDSFLIEQIVKGEMPKKEPRLLPQEIRIITAWVEAGAPNN